MGIPAADIKQIASAKLKGSYVVARSVPIVGFMISNVQKKPIQSRRVSDATGLPLPVVRVLRRSSNERLDIFYHLTSRWDTKKMTRVTCRFASNGYSLSLRFPPGACMTFVPEYRKDARDSTPLDRISKIDCSTKKTGAEKSRYVSTESP